MQPVFAVQIRLDASATSCLSEPESAAERHTSDRLDISYSCIQLYAIQTPDAVSMYHMVQRPDGRIPSPAYESVLA